MNHAAQQINDYLQINGITREDLSQKTGIPQRPINSMLAGRSPIPADSVGKFCIVLGTDPNSLLMSPAELKEAEKKLNNSLETLDADKQMEFEVAIHAMEMAVMYLINKRAFQEGMRFILNTMGGKAEFTFSSGTRTGIQDTHSTVDKCIVDIETGIMKAHTALIELEEAIEHHNKGEVG